MIPDDTIERQLADFDSLVDQSERVMDDPGTIVSDDKSASVGLILFNGANSLCSQKVRAVLAHHAMPYLSYQMDMFAGATYLPDYVRLRLAGCRSAKLPLVASHNGSTSTRHTGCDPAVVPTLVDRVSREIVIDSWAICVYLDSQACVKNEKACSLLPNEWQEEIEAELEIVDQLPNYQLLVSGLANAGAGRSKRKEISGSKLAESKVSRCNDYIGEYPNDRDLIEAYTAKRNKEQVAADTLFDPDSLYSVHKKVELEIDKLDHKLSLRSGRFLFHDTLTLADIFWAVTLFRLKNLGMGKLWNDGSHHLIDAYVEELQLLTPLRTAVLDWGGAKY